MFRPFGAVDLAELVRPKEQGKRVNSHVLPAVKERVPDYEAMRHLVTKPDRVATFADAQRDLPVRVARHQD